MTAVSQLQTVRQGLWIWLWFTVIFLIFWTWWGITASTYRFEVLEGTGQLDSQRWNVDFFFTATLLLFFVVPITLGFALDSPLRHWRRTLHVIVVAVLFFYGVVIFGYWTHYYRTANDPVATNRNNPANDRRWCNLYYNLPGSGCPQTSPTPGLVASMLVEDSVFLWKYYFLVVWLGLLILDFTLSLTTLRNAVNAYESNVLKTEEAEEQGEGQDDYFDRARLTIPPPPPPQTTTTQIVRVTRGDPAEALAAAAVAPLSRPLLWNPTTGRRAL